MASGNYDIPSVHFRASNVFTNTVAVAAYRGAGRPEAIYYIERAIDMIAGELGMDPADVRAAATTSSPTSSPTKRQPAAHTTRANTSATWTRR